MFDNTSAESKRRHHADCRRITLKCRDAFDKKSTRRIRANSLREGTGAVGKDYWNCCEK